MIRGQELQPFTNVGHRQGLCSVRGVGPPSLAGQGHAEGFSMDSPLYNPSV
jgi:hypothetical protein